MHEHQVTERVEAAAPFDLGLSVEFLRGFGPLAGEVGSRERDVAGSSLVKAWLHGGQLVEATVDQRRGAGVLRCELGSPRPITAATRRAVREHVARFLGAGDDLAPFYALARTDAPFAPVARRLRGLHHARFPTPFEAACWGVLAQRIALGQARTMKAALTKRFGDLAHAAFPEAATLAGATDAELSRLVGNARKARAVGAVARAFAKVDDAFLTSAPIAAVESWLRGIWGVGAFTSGFVLYRGLGRFSRLPASPKFLAAAKRVYGPGFSEADAARTARRYGDWAGYWSLYVWASTFVRAPAFLRR
jgi:DNA-3-methyladenine glycosylase II